MKVCYFKMNAVANAGDAADAVDAAVADDAVDASHFKILIAFQISECKTRVTGCTCARPIGLLPCSCTVRPIH